MFSFGEERRPRRPSLTPMIDVVFLLLVFFMLASRFGTDQQVVLNVAGQGGGAYSGPPRLVDISADRLSLNGIDTPVDQLVARLRALVETPSDTIVLRARDQVDLQRLIALMDRLQAAGFTGLVLIE